MVSGIAPADALEAADVAGVLEWLASGAPVFRTVPPDTPPRHLVSYFVPFDQAARCVLLGDHVKSGLRLPPGGHVEPGEDPRDTVTREASEELGLDARFWGAGLMWRFARKLASAAMPGLAAGTCCTTYPA